MDISVVNVFFNSMYFNIIIALRYISKFMCVTEEIVAAQFLRYKDRQTTRIKNANRYRRSLSHFPPQTSTFPPNELHISHPFATPFEASLSRDEERLLLLASRYSLRIHTSHQSTFQAVVGKSRRLCLCLRVDNCVGGGANTDDATSAADNRISI
jgi:hypothetical protein